MPASDPKPGSSSFTASRSLLTAALGGLLCLGAGGCTGDSDTPNVAAEAGADTGGSDAAKADTGSPGDGAVATETGADGASTGDAGDDGADAATLDDAATPDAAAEADAPPTITLSVVDKTMTLEEFTKRCDALGGKVEIHPHCGGVNSCKGMSYDTTTSVYTEHGCKGLNTCAGYSCVVP